MVEQTSLSERIVEQMADALIFSDRDGIVRLWNDGAEALFGFSRAEAMGQSLDIIIPEKLREPHWQAYHRALADGHSKYGREPLFTKTQHKDGTVFYIDMGLAVITDDQGNVTGALAVLRDATARRNRDRELRDRIAELESQLGQSGDTSG
jgi:PAS domain S-box-containing protein